MFRCSFAYALIPPLGTNCAHSGGLLSTSQSYSERCMAVSAGLFTFPRCFLFLVLLSIFCGAHACAGAEALGEVAGGGKAAHTGDLGQGIVGGTQKILAFPDPQLLDMDEAFGVGLGKHLQKYGYEDPHGIMGRHLKRVLEITEKYGLDAMIWSDMYFQLDGGSYYECGEPSQAAKDAVDPRATLVYWDYYHDDQDFYEDMLRKHRILSPKTAFAGGLWNWSGPAIDYPVAIANTIPALAAARKYGVQTVLATMWGDDGAEANLLSTLLGLQLYAELTYAEGYDPDHLEECFSRCCQADAQAFLDISLLNTVPGIVSTTKYPSNFLKIMLYQDPLVQLFEEDTKDLSMSEHYASLVGLYARRARENPQYALLFDYFAILAQTLVLKCHWHEHAAKAVRAGDRETALALSQDVEPMLQSLETLRLTRRKLWEQTNRPQGFEVLDGRMGAIRARMSTAGEKMAQFASGKREDIPELTEKTLPYRRNPDNSFQWTNTMWEITTASKIDFII